MAKGKAMPMDEYQAESDAHTLARSNLIRGNKKRHGAAIAHAQKTAHPMNAVAGEKPGGAAMPVPTGAPMGGAPMMDETAGAMPPAAKKIPPKKKAAATKKAPAGAARIGMFH